MRFYKFIALAAVAAATSCAFADAANVLVSFSTTADKYADGTAVKDGEWYALCWSADGNFEGLKLDCTPVDENDMVCLMASLAKDGKCPYTVFQIDSQSEKCKRTGTYTVILLDTRDASGAVATAKPTSVNAAVAAKEYKAGSATSGTTEKEPAGEKAWAQSTIDETVPGYKQPVIKGFKVIGDAKVQIEVDDLMPSVKYNVKMGKAADKLDNYGLETPAAGVDKATFVIEAGDAKFFQIAREPLAK